ncbi:MAG: thioredoxin family protein [Ruminococcus sp.]|nr:thioredoxin family protein [Ruminococcus sp.]
MGNKKSLLPKILIPVAIVIVIGAMWIIKMQINKPEPQTAAVIDGADFSLSVASVNYDTLFEYKVPVIVDYGSDSCIPCQQMAPVLETLNKEMEGKAFIKFIDVWKYSDNVKDVPVQVIPTQILFNADGMPFVPSDDLALEIEFTMYNDNETNEHIFTTHQGGITEEQMRKILKEMGVE